MSRWTPTACALLLVFACVPAQAQVTHEYGGQDTWVNAWGAKWVPFAEGQGKFGDNRVLGNGGGFVPLWQDDTGLIFADLRGQTDDHGQQEGNWGLGARQLMGAGDWLLGVYGFYDRVWTDNSNQFNQATFGVEALSVVWEARVNGYLPNTNKQRIGLPAAINRRNARAAFNGNTIVLTSNGVDNFEVAYTGFDAEIGALLKAWGCNNDVELRAFVGGYHFDTNERTPNITGPRGRIELRMYDFDWLGEGSRVTLGVEGQWDRVRDEQVFALLRVRIPLGNRNRKLTPLERRFVDRVMRDDDIVVNTDQQLTPEFTEFVNFTNDGTPIGPLTLVSGRTGNVPVAVANGRQLVVVDGSRGRINVDDSIVLRNGQTLQGAGFSVTGRVTGAQAIFRRRPTIRNSNPVANTIILTNNTTVRDLNVIGGRNGFFTNNLDVNSVHVTGNRVSQAVDDGFDFEGFRGTFMNNVAVNNGDDGIDFDGTVNGTVTNNRSSSNDSDGFELADIGVNGNVSDNTAERNGSDGFTFDSVSGMFNRNTANHNGDQGFEFVNVLTNGQVDGNTASGNADVGFCFFAVRGMVTNNSAIRNGSDGFNFTNVIAGGTVSRNTSTGNRFDGFLFEDVRAGGQMNGNIATNNGEEGFDFLDIGGRFDGNTATGNLSDGFDFLDVLAGGQANGNTANNNRVNGFDFLDVAGTFMNNSASGNHFDGFLFEDVDAGGQVNRNFADSNGDDGFDFLDNNGTFSNNSSNNNDDAGFEFNNQNGTAEGNTANGNGGGNGVPN